MTLAPMAMERLTLPFLLSLSDSQAQTAPTALHAAAYGIFIALVVVLLALDLFVFHRHPHAVSMKEAVGWSIVWLTLGTLFAGVVYVAYANHWLGLGLNAAMYNPAAHDDPTAPIIVRGVVDGAEAARQYLAGYVVEKSLAMDNIFVIAIIFAFFGTPAKYQHRVLFWGVLGALIMRAGLIVVGGAIVTHAQWVLIFFGLFILFTACKLLLTTGDPDPSKNVLVRLARRFLPVTTEHHGEHFVVRAAEGGWMATPLLLALIVVEVSDLIFAVDSIPAVFAITPDPFIVFTSNIFAVLGLRSLFFCLAALIAKFRYLKPALILILAFVGVKLLLLSVPPYIDDLGRWLGQEWPVFAPIKIGTGVSLGVVLGVFAVAITASILKPRA